MPLRKKKSKIKLPSPTAKIPPFPKLLRGASGPPPIFPIKVPRRRSKFDKYPRIIRIARSIKSLLKVEPDKPRPLSKFDRVPLYLKISAGLKSLLKVEPDKPVRMPSFPTLAFPRLYTRYSIMKTYTAVTDADGKITVTFPRVFRKVPGVVISPQDAGTWFEHVLSKDEFGFTVQILKTVHKHQHANSGTGGGHDHTTGNSGSSGAHDHGGDTDWRGAHDHTIGQGGGTKTSATSADVITGSLVSNSFMNVYVDINCNSGPNCQWIHYLPIDITQEVSVNRITHVHSTDINHSDHSASTEPDHQHEDVNLNTEPNHEHTVPNTNTEPNHEHTVPDSNEQEASLLANTSVTFTYFAQEET